MRYFKAIQIDFKPFIQWDCYANNEKELGELELYPDPLIVAESEIPAFIFGVCPWKIVSGELVERTAGEMAVFEAEWPTEVKKAEQTALVKTINKDSFDYDGHSFPLNESARIYYNVVRDFGNKADILTTSGDLYELIDTNIPAFFEALNTKLKDILTPIAKP